MKGEDNADAPVVLSMPRFSFMFEFVRMDARRPVDTGEGEANVFCRALVPPKGALSLEGGVVGTSSDGTRPSDRTPLRGTSVNGTLASTTRFRFLDDGTSLSSRFSDLGSILLLRERCSMRRDISVTVMSSCVASLVGDGVTVERGCELDDLTRFREELEYILSGRRACIIHELQWASALLDDGREQEATRGTSSVLFTGCLFVCYMHICSSEYFE